MNRLFVSFASPAGLHEDLIKAALPVIGQGPWEVALLVNQHDGCFRDYRLPPGWRFAPIDDSGNLLHRQIKINPDDLCLLNHSLPAQLWAMICLSGAGMFCRVGYLDVHGRLSEFFAPDTLLELAARAKRTQFEFLEEPIVRQFHPSPGT